MARLTFAETKSCCYLAYDAKKGERYRFPDGTIWDVVDHWATRLTGYKAIFLRRRGAVARGVLAFAGTNSIRDGIADAAQVIGILPIQYPQALDVAMQCQREYRTFKLAGHSLGGGLAAYVSVRTRIEANTINPAPLVAAAGILNPMPLTAARDVVATFRPNPQIINYIAGGSEIVSSSPGRNPGKDVEVPATGNFFTRHSLKNVYPSVPFPMKV